MATFTAMMTIATVATIISISTFTTLWTFFGFAHLYNCWYAILINNLSGLNAILCATTATATAM
jgi:hypothetical protein